ncbi:MAG: ATP-dependent DNA helicase [Bacteroidetes bacterium GWF2_49_14]|nr:MAG: ATP-dependent DNA helicase [Bacteroidetes bacterium GWF2_49_14]
MKKISYISSLILEGEHQQQDFKFGITDSRKIARSLVAFANTDGGRLLIGVKDNGVIAGVRTEEEYYMVESAAQMYSKPEIRFESKVWTENGKTVLEVWVPPSPARPHFVKEERDKLQAYVRSRDENIQADEVIIAVWQKRKLKKGALIRYSKDEEVLFSLLSEKPLITLREYLRSARIPGKLAVDTLSNLIILGLIEQVVASPESFFRISSKSEE